MKQGIEKIDGRFWIFFVSFLITVFLGLGLILFFPGSNKIALFYSIRTKLGLQKQNFLYEGRSLEKVTPPEILNVYKLELENLNQEILSETSTAYLSVDTLRSRLLHMVVPREMLLHHMELFVKIDKLKNFSSSNGDSERIIREGLEKLEEEVGQI